MFDLQALAALFRQRFVVRHVGHQIGYVFIAQLDQLGTRDALIFHGVVKEAGRHQVGIRARVSQQHCNLRKVVDVRLGCLALAPLMRVAPRREVCGSGDDLDVSLLDHACCLVND
jgi:hypothetical protein